MARERRQKTDWDPVRIIGQVRLSYYVSLDSVANLRFFKLDHRFTSRPLLRSLPAYAAAILLFLKYTIFRA
jgi:hypothetical protein